MGQPVFSRGTRRQFQGLCRQVGVAVAYLFGSAARGATGPLSDVDIALLLGPPHTPSSHFERRLQATVLVTRLLRAPRVDVVILNDAPPLLQFRVIPPGRILSEQDPQAKVAFEAGVMQRYCDTQPLRRQYGRALLDAIRTGRFYG